MVREDFTGKGHLSKERKEIRSELYLEEEQSGGTTHTKTSKQEPVWGLYKELGGPRGATDGREGHPQERG